MRATNATFARLLPNKTVTNNLPLCCNSSIDKDILSSEIESEFIGDNFDFGIDKNAASELEKNAEKHRDTIEKNMVIPMLSRLGSKCNNRLLFSIK